jgi:hypothetical protein
MTRTVTVDAEDLRILIEDHLDNSMCLIPSYDLHPKNWGLGADGSRALARLRAAMQLRKCDRMLRDDNGAPLVLNAGTFHPLVIACKLPAGHDGDCVPDVPAEAWG